MSAPSALTPDPAPAAGSGLNAVLLRGLSQSSDASAPAGGPPLSELLRRPAVQANEAAPPQWRGIALRAVYEESCSLHGCRVNTDFAERLPDEPVAACTVSSIDLSLNFVGRVGLRPVLAVARCAPELRHLSLGGNFLDNSAAAEVCAAVDGMPSLRALDLSCNPISQAAGKLLSCLLRNNANICSVNVEGTLISPALKAALQRKAAANCLLSPDEERAAVRKQWAVRLAQRQQQARRLQRQPYRPASAEPGDRPAAAEPPAADEDAEPLDSLIALCQDSSDQGAHTSALAAVLDCLD
eukprot:TRINITY_DN55276_c0_g1_i1.p1 TRINITY_DN55276_c0_g1~~TRINITY_DN55276_c0_g1_i1.p1  ORF type:complete len:328 (+),score=134.06 TRINITY_DN55276_c0_g1_i1:91-984(+)